MTSNATFKLMESNSKNTKRSGEGVADDEIDELVLSFVDQSAVQLARLQAQILLEKTDDSWSGNRLFRNNMFEDIKPERRQHLRKLLEQTLKALGHTINQNLKPNLANKKLLVVDRKDPNNYVHDRHGVIYLKPKNHIRYCAPGKSYLGLMLHVITKVLANLRSDTYMTKRELYYLSREFLHKGGTKKLHNIITDICCLIGCSQVNLNILSQTKGLVYGDLKFKLKSGEVFDCMSKEGGVSLPTGQYPIVKLESSARFILITEKDSVFQKIVSREKETNFVRNYKAIIFGGKGYPDIPSRAFINFLWNQLHIPILALTDADPHGCEIVCCYKFGCYNTASEQLYLAVPQIRWLGLLPTDVSRLQVPNESTSSQSDIDIKKINSLLQRSYLANKPAWKQQLNHLRCSGKKAELESLDTTGDYLVRTYLPNKLRYGSWL